MTSKYSIWVANTGMHEVGDDVKYAILAFAHVVSKHPHVQGGILGFAADRYSRGQVPVIECYTATNVLAPASLLAVLYGVTDEEWVEHGPPKSLELTADDLKERGFPQPPVV